MARVDYDREARRYRAGREVPLERLEPWRAPIAGTLMPGQRPLLDVGAGTGLWTRAFSAWFGAEVVALEPSSGMREVGAEIGLPPRAHYLAARAEQLPLGPGSCRAAWLSTVVHHLVDLSACAAELRRTLVDGAQVLVRNSFPGRLDQVELFRYFPAARAVAEGWPSLELVLSTFATAGFLRHRVVRVQEGRVGDDLGRLRAWALAMRHTDSTLAPISDAEFDEGLGSLDRAIADGRTSQPMGMDLVVLS
jgi:SAM-dependent methyltransferase